MECQDHAMETPSFAAAVAEAIVDIIENPDKRYLPKQYFP